MDDPNDTSCNSTRRLAFSGLARKGTQIILAATGGHHDYSGNEVTGINLGADVPGWALFHAPSPADKVVQNASYYLDGLPSARHAYGHAHFSTTRNRLMLHASRFVYGSGVTFFASNGFNLDTNRWDPAGTWNDGYAPVCRDERDNVWASSGYFHLYKWDPAADRWTETGYFANAIYGPLAHDTNRDILFQLAWGNGQADGVGVSAYKYNAYGSVQTPITFTLNTAYSRFQDDKPAYASMVFDPNGDRFLFWDGASGRLYEIKANSGNVWDINIVTTTGIVPPPASGNYGRMAYLPELRGCVFMPSGHQNLYFIRLA
ncbi:MAG: hypothetical protein H7274_10710 [Rhodoferax sp.]|nr:hypothetical protein [Rhodoferax sp.]